MRKILLAVTAIVLLASATPSLSAPCRDKNGKFVKCPPKPKVCRDAKGHFKKC